MDDLADLTLFNDYIAFIKLSHVIAGVYIWETVITTGFELDVLRGKRPYRWTIWLYLGTRYTYLLAFVFFLNIDGARTPCHPVVMTTLAMGYCSWAFASLTIVLRVIAIWSRNIIISLIAVGVWLGTFAWTMCEVIILTTTYDGITNTCILLHPRMRFLNAIGILVVDAVLLLTMLIGLLRHPHRNSAGMWGFLYQQCIIWIALAMFSEIVVVVFLFLDLNDVWKQMFLVPAAATLSIGAARMYRSLSDRGSLTQYVSSDLPQFPPGNSILPKPSRGATMQFASVTQSGGTRTMGEAPMFLLADQTHGEFVPGRSTQSLGHRNLKDRSVLTT